MKTWGLVVEGIEITFNLKLVKETRPKKLVLFLEIGRVRIFYHSPTGIVDCISEYIFLLKKNTEKTRRQKGKETKKKKKRDYLWKI